MTKKVELSERILDKALALAEMRHWEAVRLYDVAEGLGIGLDELRSYYREKEDLVDAWFDRADRAMLQEASTPGFVDLAARARLHTLIMAWLDTLAPHRRITRQMIHGKLEPGHLHIQIPAVMRISRTVQWIREAARRDATYVWRALEEVGLTSIYLTTFGYWAHDDSPGSQATRRFLERLLKGAEYVVRCPICPGRHHARAPSPASAEQPADAASQPPPV